MSSNIYSDFENVINSKISNINAICKRWFIAKGTLLKLEENKQKTNELLAYYIKYNGAVKVERGGQTFSGTSAGGVVSSGYLGGSFGHFSGSISSGVDYQVTLHYDKEIEDTKVALNQIEEQVNKQSDVTLNYLKQIDDEVKALTYITDTVLQSSLSRLKRRRLISIVYKYLTNTSYCWYRDPETGEDIKNIADAKYLLDYIGKGSKELDLFKESMDYVIHNYRMTDLSEKAFRTLGIVVVSVIGGAIVITAGTCVGVIIYNKQAKYNSTLKTYTKYSLDSHKLFKKGNLNSGTNKYYGSYLFATNDTKLYPMKYNSSTKRLFPDASTYFSYNDSNIAHYNYVMLDDITITVDLNSNIANFAWKTYACSNTLQSFCKEEIITYSTLNENHSDYEFSLC